MALSLTLGVLAWVTPARAADIENVEALIRQGVELRQQRHDVRALPLFQKAYSMSRTPRTAGQLGLCEMALGYWLEAENHLGEALSLPEHPWVARNLGDLTGALATVRTNISEVTIGGGPAGAEVFINGQSFGRLPLTSPVRLGKGPADIEFRAPGHLTASRLLKVPGGTQEVVNIVLTKAPPSDVPAVTVASEAASPSAPASDPTPADSGRTSTTNAGRVAAWVTGAGAGLGLIFGAVETIVWVGKKNDFDNHKDPTTMAADCATSQLAGHPVCQTLHDDLVRARTLAFVGYGVAAALGVTSAILFATSGANRSKTDTAFACAPDLSNRGVGCSFSF